MLFRHVNKTLNRIQVEPDYNGGYSMAVVQAFRELMRTVIRAGNENDLRALKSLHFEKLKGKRKHEYSMRINNQFRLIFQIESAVHGNRLVITDIEKHYE
jgi:proteic killer suppression protein